MVVIRVWIKVEDYLYCLWEPDIVTEILRSGKKGY